MKTFSHRHGLEAVRAADVYEEIVGFLLAPRITVVAKSSKTVKQHIKQAMKTSGWALNPQLAPGFDLDVNGMKSRISLTTQSGNIARAFYDLLKFQALHVAGRIDAAVLVLPTKRAANALGSNIAQFERVTNELELFKHVITVPLLVLSFE
jgi:hypothetical protein